MMFKKPGRRMPLIYRVEKAGVKMLRPVRNGIILRVGLRIALLLILVCALVGVWRISPYAASVAGNRTDQGTLDKNLLDAIRDGDRTQAQYLLQHGANANARDEAG